MSWSTDVRFDDLMLTGTGGNTSISYDKPQQYGSPDSSFYGERTPTMSCGRISISELTLGIPGKQLTGVIIAKEDPRSFPSKKDPGTERHLLSFTLRDSPLDSINATCWGSKAYTQDLADTFHIGDVVELHQYIVQSKPTDGSDERFRPPTSGAFQLSISENRSSMQLYSGGDAAEIAALSHIPAAASNDYYTISDVTTNGMQLHGQSINMMAVVRHVGQVRSVTTKAGKQLKCCEIKLFDETSPYFLLNLWSEELIGMAQNWTPKDNVIFAVDVRVTFDDFKKTMVATANSKTIVTINPDTREAHALYQYAQTVDLVADSSSEEVGWMGDSNRVDLDSIQIVYTVLQVKDKMVPTADGGTEYGILYTHVSKFDIDSDTPISITKCSKCRRRVSRDSGTCANRDCPHGSLSVGAYGDFQSAQQETTTHYHIMVDLTDHTATLPSCFLMAETAEKMLNCPDMGQNLYRTGFGLYRTAECVRDFYNYNEEQRTNLKWDFLLEKCKVYVKMMLPTFDRPQPSVRVLSCVRADLQEAAKFLQ